MPIPRLKTGSALPLVLMVALALVAAACGGDEEDASTTVGGQRANHHGSQDVAGENELDLELDDFYFEPTVLTGSAGETLTLDLENEGDTEHNFSLTDQGIDQDVEAGEKAEVSVTFADSGPWSSSASTTRTWGCEGRFGSRAPRACFDPVDEWNEDE